MAEQMTCGEALGAVLNVLGVKQSTFAVDAGISPAKVNQLIHGHMQFTPETIAHVADGLALRLMAIDVRHRMATLRRGPMVAEEVEPQPENPVVENEPWEGEIGDLPSFG